MNDFFYAAVKLLSTGPIHFSLDFVCQRITLPKHRSDVVIQPGLFKGTFCTFCFSLTILSYFYKTITFMLHVSYSAIVFNFLLPAL